MESPVSFWEYCGHYLKPLTSKQHIALVPRDPRSHLTALTLGKAPGSYLSGHVFPPPFSPAMFFSILESRDQELVPGNGTFAIIKHFIKNTYIKPKCSKNIHVLVSIDSKRIFIIIINSGIGQLADY